MTLDKPPFWSGKDALGRPIRLQKRPERIVSLVPSQTELLVDLGVGSRLVGRTRYCVHPSDFLAPVPAIGGTKRVEMDRVEALRPDLILAEKEENPEELVTALTAIAPVYVTNVVSISSAISMCRDVGQLVGLAAQGNALADDIAAAMSKVKRIAAMPERVLYLIWKGPWMAAGPGTFIHSCLEHVGFQNAAVSLRAQAGHSPRYPELDAAQMQRLQPERVFLSSEPFPFNEKNAREIREILPGARIELVNGELFSWYGSRMLKMPAYWRTLSSALW